MFYAQIILIVIWVINAVNKEAIKLPKEVLKFN